MSEEKFGKWISEELKKEGKQLEEQARSEPETVKMPEDSYADLMRRVGAEEPKKKPFHIRKRTLLAVALAAVLVAAVGVGASGAKLFVPKVEERPENGEYNVAITSGDENDYIEVSEDEAYEEIEERLGILALRLNSKPKGMELEKVYIDEDMGEAQMEFYYKDSILKIYENKQSDDAAFHTSVDGEIIETVETFHNGIQLDVIGVYENDNTLVYTTQFEYGNAYYYMTGDLTQEEFEEILYGIFFEAV